MIKSTYLNERDMYNDGVAEVMREADFSVVGPLEEEQFLRGFAAVQFASHDNARRKGFWDQYSDSNGRVVAAIESVPSRLALIHSEISEGLEAWRKNLMDDKLPDVDGLDAELADTVIRIMDLAEAMGYNLAQTVLAKMQYNLGRPKMHGGKRI